MNVIADKRVLIVEDEFFVAVTASEMLQELGAIVVGPAGNLAQALRLAESESIDIALLDINLHGKSSEPVAAKLDERGIPLVFATGYGNGDSKDASGRYVLGKPYTQDKLAAILTRALGAKPGAQSASSDDAGEIELSSGV